MKKKICILILTLVNLLISLKILINLAFFIDDNNLSANIVFGGDWGLYLYWIKLFILIITLILSIISVLKKD